MILESSARSFVFALECTKNNILRPLAPKGCARGEPKQKRTIYKNTVTKLLGTCFNYN